MSGTTQLKLEVADSDVTWSDLVRSLAADSGHALADYGRLDLTEKPVMEDCMDQCETFCECAGGACAC